MARPGSEKQLVSAFLNQFLKKGIAEAFYEHRLAEYSKRVTPADFHMAHIALCFGLGSASARQRAVEQGY